MDSSNEIVNILNAILVNEGVRSAMLVQPHDYKERTGTDPITLSIVNKIKRLFPEIVSSDKYETYQGTIISKKSYDGKIISLGNMGKILGYPCYNDYETLNREEPLHDLQLVVSYNDNELPLPLFNNVCKSKDKKTVDTFNSLSTKAYRALTNEKYKGVLDGIRIHKINRVYVTIEDIIPMQHIINKMMTTKKLSDDEINALIEALYNSGFSNLLDYEFQYDNPIHKGILVGLLLHRKYDRLSPFYPIQRYPKQQENVEQITIQLENGLLDVLEKTKTRTKISKAKPITRTRRRTL
jgi:hypothetical protein